MKKITLFAMTFCCLFMGCDSQSPEARFVSGLNMDLFSDPARTEQPFQLDIWETSDDDAGWDIYSASFGYMLQATELWEPGLGDECSPCTNIFDDSSEPPYQVKCQFTGVGTCPEWEEFDVPPVPNGEIFTLEQTTWCTWEYIIPPPPNTPYHGWCILWNPYKHNLGLIWAADTWELPHYIECPIGPHQEFEDECWKEFSDNCILCEDLTPLGGLGKVWWVDDFYGDFNFDGIVDGKDFALFADNWYNSIEGMNYDLMYDATQDGQTTEDDLAVFVSNWLKERPE